MLVNPDGTLTDETVESFFDEAVMGIFAEPMTKNILTTEQKRKVIEALDTVITESEDGNTITISMLFFTVILTGVDDDPQLEIKFNVSALTELSNRKFLKK